MHLSKYGMEEYLNKSAYEMSLGQKQRITIAGVLSIKPKYIIFDEPTAMLDPEGKEDIRKITKELKKLGFTIIYITNIIEEIFLADRIIFLEKGKIAKEFKKEEILDNIKFLEEKNMTIPNEIKIMQQLKEKGINLSLFEGE